MGRLTATSRPSMQETPGPGVLRQNDTRSIMHGTEKETHES